MIDREMLADRLSLSENSTLDVFELIRGRESSANVNLPQEERTNHREKEEESILVNLAIIPVSFTDRNSYLITSYSNRSNASYYLTT